VLDRGFDRQGRSSVVRYCWLSPKVGLAWLVESTIDEPGDITGIIAWVVLGLLAGMVAKAIMPGRDPGGLIVTAVIGIAGAVIGGLIAEWAGFDGLSSFFELRTWIIAVLGSLLLLALYRAATRGRHAHSR
jgi:uncharacterized membrane protein YeaQ/YmgE (transglycosylase-associated protein family)